MSENDSKASTINQCDLMDYIDEELAAILGDDFPGSSPADSNDSSSTLCTTEPPSNFMSNVSAPVILNFGNGNPQNTEAMGFSRNNDGAHKEQTKRTRPASKTSRFRPASQTYDHIMAERKRREQLSQCFIAFSAIFPGLKKMDKTSVLGDTIKYLKHLQNRVKTLDEQTAKQTTESIVLVKKSQIIEDEGSSDEQSDDGPSLPKIEARVCSKSILLKVHCQKSKGVLVKLLAEVEKLNVDVVNTSVTSFGSLALNITVVAEMEEEIKLSGKDIVKALQSALQNAGSN